MRNERRPTRHTHLDRMVLLQAQDGSGGMLVLPWMRLRFLESERYTEAFPLGRFLMARNYGSALGLKSRIIEDRADRICDFLRRVSPADTRCVLYFRRDEQKYRDVLVDWATAAEIALWKEREDARISRSSVARA